MAEPTTAPPPSRTWAGAAGDVVDAFKTSPVLLLIVLLNGIFACAAGYYLLQVEHYRADDRKALFELLQQCTMRTVPLDYLNSQRKE
jgi:hypothetical protein